MKTWTHSAVLAIVLIGVVAPALSDGAKAEDLREAIPSDMFLAVYGRHNPERDYQTDYYKEVFQTVEKSRIVERVAQMIQSRMSDNDVAQMAAFRDSVKEALKSVEWKKLAGFTEIAYGQRFDGPLTQNVLIMRFPENSAGSLIEGISNLLKMAKSGSGGNITVIDDTIGDARLKMLQLPPGVPFSPVFGVRNDLFIYASSPKLAKESLRLLDDAGAESKFDDERVKEALKHLPAPEDALVFFDGQALSKQLEGIVSFIQKKSGDDDEGQRFAELLNSFMSEAALIDYEVTVEYTDGYRNRTAAFGKAMDGYKSTVFGKMVANQQLFADWSKWVPADASSFSLQSGVNLHPLHEWVKTKVPALFPGSEEAFFELRDAQEKLDIHLDNDIWQGFGGESISINLPGPLTPLGPSQKSVLLLRCTKPDRIRELIHRGLEALQQVPQIRNYGVTVTECESLEGFEEINAGLFAMMGGMRPIFGFRDGWLVLGTHADAVEKVFLTRGGESESIATADTFTQFAMPVSGDVTAISYSNTGETIRNIANGMQQIGALIPMVLAMSGNQQNAAKLEPLQDVLSLLPTAGRIVGKFDFIESTFSVSQPGPTSDTWIRRTATMIRPPKVKEPAKKVSDTPATVN